jgi:hypothetical protein
MTDLHQIVAKIYEIRLVPIDARSLLSLIGVTLLPLVPVLLLDEPFDVLFNKPVRVLIGGVRCLRTALIPM